MTGAPTTQGFNTRNTKQSKTDKYESRPSKDLNRSRVNRSRIAKESEVSGIMPANDSTHLNTNSVGTNPIEGSRPVSANRSGSNAVKIDGQGLKEYQVPNFKGMSMFARVKETLQKQDSMLQSPANQSFTRNERGSTVTASNTVTINDNHQRVS